MKKILILFAKDWDLSELNKKHYAEKYHFYHEGFNIFRFPENCSFLNFNVLNYIDKLEKKYRLVGLDGVVSNHEQFGTLIAAVLAERLGLRGNNPQAIIACQHKLHSRALLQQWLPDTVPSFSHLTYPLNSQEVQDFQYPVFVKPIKATYSVLAKQINSFAELKKHLQCNFFEEIFIRQLVKPFQQLMSLYPSTQVDPFGLIVEDLMQGEQMNIDGYCVDGNVHILGVIDEVMYPQTRSFMRFEYPSKQPTAVQERAFEITKEVLKRLDYRLGFFNIEFIYDKHHDDLKIIEINPRMATQLINLYDRVDGCMAYDILLSLAVGETPESPQTVRQFKTSASFILRHFQKPRSHQAPSKARIDSALLPYPDAKLMLYKQKGYSLACEMRMLGSYRYAVLNIGGNSKEDLFARFQHICQSLNFDNTSHHAY